MFLIYMPCSPLLSSSEKHFRISTLSSQRVRSFHFLDKRESASPLAKINPFRRLWAHIVLWTSGGFGKSAAWIHPSLMPSGPCVFSAGWAVSLEPTHINARHVLIITHACRVCHLPGEGERTNNRYNRTKDSSELQIFFQQLCFGGPSSTSPHVSYLPASQFCNALIRPLQRRVGFLTSSRPLMGFHQRRHSLILTIKTGAYTREPARIDLISLVRAAPALERAAVPSH